MVMVVDTAVAGVCTPCDAPSGLTVTDVGAGFADLAWTSDGTKFDVEWGSAGFAQGSGTLVQGIETNPWTLTGLQASRNYQFYVRQNCGSETSAWTGPFSFSTNADQCPPGAPRLVFVTQKQVDDFGKKYPFCSNAESITISGDDITSLIPLNQLSQMWGSLTIENTTRLQDVDGLNGLNYMSGVSIRIHGNTGLRNISGLTGDFGMVGNLEISSNPVLTAISGLGGLRVVSNKFELTDNPKLSDVSGFSKLVRVSGDFWIQNTGLATLSGFIDLRMVMKRLILKENALLTDISVLQNFDWQFFTEVIVADNPVLGVCQLSKLCDYLLALRRPATITGNGEGCENAIAVLAQCGQVLAPDAEGTVYVNQGVQGGNGSGGSWENAAPELADIIRYAKVYNTYSDVKVKRIFVAKGVYKPKFMDSDVFDLVNPSRVKAFVILKDVAIYGGFDPENNITDLTHQRLLPSAEGDNGGTVLSGDIDDIQGISENDALTVVYAVDDVGTGRIDGFTISGGYGDETPIELTINSRDVRQGRRGAGMRIEYASPVIENVLITGNKVLGMGAGMYNYHSNPVLSNVYFTYNAIEGSSGYGAALYNSSSDPVLTHVIMKHNGTSNGSSISGGVVYNDDSNPVLTNVMMDSNVISSSRYLSGGVMYSLNSNPVLTNVTISRNTVSSGNVRGGVLYFASYNANETKKATLHNVNISGNHISSPDGMDGGVVLQEWEAGSKLLLVNSTITGNTMESDGVVKGSVVGNYTSELNIRNSLFWNNLLNGTSDLGDNEIFNDGTGGVSVQYSLAQSYAGGSEDDQNLVGIDPLFADAANGDYRLLACSPAVNAGTPDLTGLDLPPTDLSGNERIVNGRIDIGAYEFAGAVDQSASISGSGVTVSASQQNEGITYYANDCRTLVAAIETTGEPADVSGPVTARVWIQDTPPAHYVRRHYQIVPANNAAGATGRVTLYFTQDDFDKFNDNNPAALLPAGPDDTDEISNLLVEKRGGESSDDTGGPSSYPGAAQTISDVAVIWNAAASRWEVSFDVTGFSGFFIKTDNSPLPVSWISFDGYANEENQAVLSWKVNETHVAGYEVERSIDARSFQTIAAVAGKGNGLNTYQYTHVNPLSFKSYYRIRQIDTDGAYSYSKIVSLSGRSGTGLRIYPNPAQGSVTVEVPSPAIGTNLKIVSAAGVLFREVKATERSVSIDLSGLPPGLYLIRTNDGQVGRLVKE